MYRAFVILVCKFINRFSKLLGHEGSVIGGHWALKLDKKILNKARNTTLKGEDYESFVQYWMGYGGGYGLHDASWRRVFGTQDYKWNGSHGCINMPTAAAKKLYGMVEVGTPLYIKY